MLVKRNKDIILNTVKVTTSIINSQDNVGTANAVMRNDHTNEF